MRSFVFAVFAGVLASACAGSPPPSSPPSQPGPFLAERVKGLGEPEVVVENTSDVPFTIQLKGATPTTLEVPPHDKRSVRLKPGNYAYQASAPDVLPAEGEHLFALDMRYVWKFEVVMKPADDPSFAGTGWHCFEVKAETPFHICARSGALCEKARGTPSPEDPPIGACTEQAVVYGFVDTAKNVAIFGLTMKACEAIRPQYLKEAADPSKVTPCEEKK